jgi:hypothetical protein
VSAQAILDFSISSSASRCQSTHRFMLSRDDPEVYFETRESIVSLFSQPFRRSSCAWIPDSTWEAVRTCGSRIGLVTGGSNIALMIDCTSVDGLLEGSLPEGEIRRGVDDKRA